MKALTGFHRIRKVYRLSESLCLGFKNLRSLKEEVFTGNPRVTPEVTRDVCLLARLMAANLYFAQIEDLMFEVKITILLSDFHFCYFPLATPDTTSQTFYTHNELNKTISQTYEQVVHFKFVGEIIWND